MCILCKAGHVESLVLNIATSLESLYLPISQQRQASVIKTEDNTPLWVKHKYLRFSLTIWPLKKTSIVGSSPEPVASLSMFPWPDPQHWSWASSYTVNLVSGIKLHWSPHKSCAPTVSAAPLKFDSYLSPYTKHLLWLQGFCCVEAFRFHEIHLSVLVSCATRSYPDPQVEVCSWLLPRTVSKY